MDQKNPEVEKWLATSQTEQIALMGDVPAQHKHKIKEEFCFALSENKCDRMKRWLINYKDIQPTNSALEEFLIKTKNLSDLKHNQGVHYMIEILNMYVQERGRNMMTQFKPVADAIDWQHRIIFLTALKSDKRRKRLIEEEKDKDYSAWVEIAKTNELVDVSIPFILPFIFCNLIILSRHILFW